MAAIKNNSVIGLLSIIGNFGISPVLMMDGTNLGNTVMSLGDVRFSVMRISISENPSTDKRTLCVEWSADGHDYKSYFDAEHSELVK